MKSLIKGMPYKLLALIFLVLNYNNFLAQVYDTYGRSQATREWQNYESHHASVSSKSSSNYKTNSVGNNSAPMTQWDFDRLNRMYGKNTAARIPTLEEIEAGKKIQENMAAYRKKLEYDNAQKLELKRQEDYKFAKLKDQFQQNFEIATSQLYDSKIRESAFRNLISFMDSSYRVVKNDYDYYKTVELKKTLEKMNDNKIKLLAHKVNFHAQQHNYKAAHDLSEKVLIEERLDNLQQLFYLKQTVYAGLLSLPYPTEKLMERAAYLYKLDSNTVNLFAYSLFLNKKYDVLSELYHRHIKLNLTNEVRIEYLNKLVLLNFIRGNDTEAFSIYNANSSIKINEKQKLLSLITANMASNIRTAVDSTIFPSSTLLDIEMLANVYTDSKDAQGVRYYAGEVLHCERLLKPYTDNKSIESSSTTTLSTTMDELTYRGNLSEELRNVAENIGFPTYTTANDVYYNELNELVSYCKSKCIHALNFKINKGFLIITSSDKNEKFYYRIEDLEMPVLDKNAQDYLIVFKCKPGKTGYRYRYFSDPNYAITEWNPNFFCDKNSQVKGAYPLFVNLFKKLQKP